jgi:TolB-like protein
VNEEVDEVVFNEAVSEDVVAELTRVKGLDGILTECVGG